MDLSSRLKAWDSACRSPSGCMKSLDGTQGVALGYAVPALRAENQVGPKYLDDTAREGEESLLWGSCDELSPQERGSIGSAAVARVRGSERRSLSTIRHPTCDLQFA